MSAPVPITIQGVEYPSMAAAAKAGGITTSALQGRLKAGWPDEKLFEPVQKKGPRPIEIDGQVYPTITAAAKANGIKVKTLQSRMRAGQTGTDLLRAKRRRPVRDLDTGKVYPSIRAAADAVFITRGRIWEAVSGLSQTAAGHRWEYVE